MGTTSAAPAPQMRKRWVLEELARRQREKAEGRAAQVLPVLLLLGTVRVQALGFLGAAIAGLYFSWGFRAFSGGFLFKAF